LLQRELRAGAGRNKNMIIKLNYYERNFSTIRVDLFCLTGSWKGKSLTSLRSIAIFEGRSGHIGNENPQIAFRNLQSRILVNAQKSELAN